MLTLLVSLILITFAVGIYIFTEKKKSLRTRNKIIKARESGLHEPVSIHPYIDPAKCIGSGSCVKACPEKDVLGLVDGRARNINAGRCVGHGACAAACPVGAITLVFGTETRGVEIPDLTPEFETNVPGIFIAGELGGMGLIKNAVTQGREAIEYIACRCGKDKKIGNVYDVVIVGAGPAGISASLQALKMNLKCVTIEQEDIGGSVLHYPRHKIVMTSPMELPLHGKMNIRQTTKEALLDMWMKVIEKATIKIHTHEKLTEVRHEGELFRVVTSKAEYLTRNLLLAIGRRGTPRKLEVPGEALPKVSYKLLEPDQHHDQDILIVGGGNSAVEAALSVAARPNNRVTLSYRGQVFSRVRQENMESLKNQAAKGSIRMVLESQVKEIGDKMVRMETPHGDIEIPNDYVYIFAGGELPNDLLKKIGIKIEKHYGQTS